MLITWQKYAQLRVGHPVYLLVVFRILSNIPTNHFKKILYVYKLLSCKVAYACIFYISALFVLLQETIITSSYTVLNFFTTLTK